MTNQADEPEEPEIRGILNPWWTIKWLAKALPTFNKSQGVAGLFEFLAEVDPDVYMSPIQVADVFLQFAVHNEYSYQGCGDPDCEACDGWCDEDHGPDPITDAEVERFAATLNHEGADPLKALMDYLKKPTADEEENEDD